MRPFVVMYLGLALCAASAGSASAESYFPLQLGNTWHYSSEKDGAEVQSISRTDVVHGRDVFVNSFVASKLNLGLDQYWFEGPDGDLFLVGFYRKLDGFGRLYDPPLLWLDAPLALGREWTSSSDVISLPDMTVLGTIQIGQRVYEAGPITVPAGTFEAFGVGQLIPRTDPMETLASTRLDGTRPTAGTNASEWYAVGVGEIQYGFGAFQLTAYEVPTEALASTWGRVKRAYR